jgi:hypothetical protein
MVSGLMTLVHNCSQNAVSVYVFVQERVFQIVSVGGRKLSHAVVALQFSSPHSVQLVGPFVWL